MSETLETHDYPGRDEYAIWARTPMPGDKLGDQTVLASVIYRETDEGNEHTVILLNDKPPFYTIALIAPMRDGTWHFMWEEDHPNIIPAVESYEQNGGDY